MSKLKLSIQCIIFDIFSIFELFIDIQNFSHTLQDLLISELYLTPTL